METCPLPAALAEQFASGRAFDVLPVGVYSCDAAGMVVQFNRRAAELWGRIPVIGDTDERFCGSQRLFWPDGRPLPHAESPMAEVLQSGASIRDQTVVIERPDGTRVSVLVNINPVFNADGSIAGAVNCFQDISDLRRAQETLQDNQRHLHTLLDALPAAVYTTDAQGRITFANEAAAEFAERRPEPDPERSCLSWRLYRPDGTLLPADECPAAVALKERRAVGAAELIAERADGSRVPVVAYPVPLFDSANQLLGAVNMLVDVSERKQAEQSQRLLISELSHRVKNTLATVQAIASQTLRRARSPSEFVCSFSGRVQALARAHGLLTQSTWVGAQLDDLVRDQLLLGGTDGGRVICAGPAVLLEPQAALHLALVLHELGTNARKHGALSVPEGKLSVSWEVQSSDRRTLHMHWIESGGPRVTAPIARGFGSEMIEQSLRAHDGEACVQFAATGVRCDIVLPLPGRVVGRSGGFGAAQTHAAAEPHSPARSTIQRKRILVIEDEPLIAMDIVASLQKAGCRVVGPAETLNSAMLLAQEAQIDAALLDANLGGFTVDEVAATLTMREVPFAFVTGYGRRGLPRAFHDALVVAKPFSTDQLLAAVHALMAREARVGLDLRGG